MRKRAGENEKKQERETVQKRNYKREKETDKKIERENKKEMLWRKESKENEMSGKGK